MWRSSESGSSKYVTRNLGQLQLQLHKEFSGQISFSEFCVPAGTIEFIMRGRSYRENSVLFKLTFPGYELEALVYDGMVFFRRNDDYQHSEPCTDDAEYSVAIQWDIGSIGCGVAPGEADDEQMNAHMRMVRTNYFVPPAELVKTLRTHNLLCNSAYQSADDLFVTVLDCLHLCELDIRHLGGERFCWEKKDNHDYPLGEPEISRFVATFLTSHGAARNFDVACDPIAGSGKPDFWVVGPVASAGLAKIVIEAKKAENKELVHGFQTQLPEYMRRLGTTHGIFLTYWLKSTRYPHPKKFERYTDLETSLLHPLERGSGIRTVGIDLSWGPTPSHKTISKTIRDRPRIKHQ